MKKIVLLFLIIFLAACGSEASVKELKEGEATTPEEIIAANEPAEVVELDKEVEFKDFTLRIDHYFRTDKIYEMNKLNNVKINTPESGLEYIVLYLETTNHSGEENPLPYIFNLVGDNKVYSNPFLAFGNTTFEKSFPATGIGTERLVDGGTIEGYLMMELSKEDENPALRLKEMGIISDPEELDIPLN